MRTYSPVRLVRNSSRPYLPSNRARNMLGTLSRPLSSMRVGELPLNTLLLHFCPQNSTEIVGDASPGVNRKILSLSRLRPDLSPFHRQTEVHPWEGLGTAAQRSGYVNLRATIPARGLMLRAALIGFGSSGKTTLFQLMTSAREAARGTQKGDTSVGISKVPDARLDRLTAM